MKAASFFLVICSLLLAGCSTEETGINYIFTGDNNQEPYEGKLALLTNPVGEPNLVSINHYVDTIYVRFRVMESCYLTASDSVRHIGDTIIITPTFTGEESGHLFCSYGFEYKFAVNENIKKEIIIE